MVVAGGTTIGMYVHSKVDGSDRFDDGVVDVVKHGVTRRHREAVRVKSEPLADEAVAPAQPEQHAAQAAPSAADDFNSRWGGGSSSGGGDGGDPGGAPDAANVFAQARRDSARRRRVAAAVG